MPIGQKISTFLHIFLRSLVPSERYYRKLLHTKLIFSLKYFFTLVFILNFFAVCLFIVKLNESLPEIASVKDEFIHMLDEYPKDLVVILKNGELMTTLDRPYFMWFTTNDTPHPVLIIDEQANSSQTHRYGATVFITAEGITINLGNTSHQYRFRSTDNFFFDHVSVEKLRENAVLFFRQLPIIMLLSSLILFFLLPIVIFVLLMFMLSFLSLAVYAGIKLIHRRITYRKVFHISLHSSTTPLLLEYIFYVRGLTIFLPFGFLFFYILFLTLSLFETYKKD